ncbi:hypothetical protein [Capnocytophaga sp. oral taxon 380]|jgi:hypothetical protein|uniref:hypothetical protein n=1 Tax=Capnocytophaga sp. oral taxon 380 TaxID=712217 RepID=UPI0002A1B1BC|nr:hypothetical protein [Capnocytophaga sp. oral taxon 380]EKY08934.1 hypothetical protein HMPREF9078_00611 [Capnocytophaga sp. oral taxon 380 str. F0488]
MNTIILKNQLDFQQYQLAVKALADMGIEVAEPEDSFEITEEDIRSIERAREDIKHGRVHSNEEVFNEARALEKSFL